MHRSLSGLRLEDTPRGEGPVLLFLSHSFPFQYFKPGKEGIPRDDCAHSVDRVTNTQII